MPGQCPPRYLIGRRAAVRRGRAEVSQATRLTKTPPALLDAGGAGKKRRQNGPELKQAEAPEASATTREESKQHGPKKTQRARRPRMMWPLGGTWQ